MTTINDPLVGTTYDGRYRIEKRIGAGGMANVYLAQDETLGRRVAIKVLHQRFAEDSQFVERFLREASAAARLNHPNIVQVYDRGQAGGSYYIAMEFVDGMTLKDLVKRRGGLTEQECLAYGRQALHALRFAHRNGIVHRDVKPHNMMVDTDGRLKIADFGIARAAADADSGLTEAGSIVGTAQYLSPEQAQGHDVAASSDLYSLGVVMFEMATGRVPFDGESPVNVALKHVKDPVPRPSSFNTGVSVALESIILKAMEKEPARRYATADEMLADLDRAREGSQTQAMTQVLGAAALGAGATQVTPITPAAAPITNRQYETPVAPEPAWPDSGWDDEDADAKSKWRWLAPLLIALVVAALAAWVLFSGREQGEPVPDVVGQTLPQARTAITAEGFTVGEVDERADADAPEGEVLEQTPEGGEELEAGEAIDLVVSSGPEPQPVPDVVGDARNPAAQAIRDAGFTPAFGTGQASDTVDAGRVISQSPAAGEEVDPGTTVTLILSTGAEAVTVPSVIGQPVDEARATLEGGEFEFEVRTETVPSAQAEGIVVDQNPAANEPLEPGGRITLQVSSGRNTVPDVAGTGIDEAARELENAGFVVERIAEPTTDQAQIGVVFSTDPPSGGTLGVGQRIRVTYGEPGGDPNEGGEPVPGDGSDGNNGIGNG